jgi:hypothetical protein
MARILYPIREYLGRYSSFMIKLYGRDSAWFREGKVERFLSHFPNAKCLSDFTIADVCDYRVFRIDAGVALSTIEIELRCVRDWFVWMQQHQDLPLHNIVVARDENSKERKSKNRLSLIDLKRLLSVSSDELRAYILAICGDQPVKHNAWIGRQLWKAAQEAKLPWLKSIGILRQCIHSLWGEIIKREYPKLRDAFLKETEPSSNPPRYVEAAPTNEWASVYDLNDIT